MSGLAACSPDAGPTVGPSPVTPPADKPSATGGVGDAALAASRAALVLELGRLDITDARVLEVIGRVPRHEFVPATYRSRSYENTALPIAENQTISPPYMVALMTQLLELKGGERVLEIGTGSGYQAAVLGELVGAGEVYTVEIRDALRQKAKERLESLHERDVLHYEKLETVVGDGAKGHPEAAPYDAIVVTAAPRRTPVALLNQLKEGGRMVIPVGDYSHQQLQLIRKGSDGSISEEVIQPTLFVPLEPSARAARRP
jgi:protein-L-isoaspartate(D-aspartate) O-methyltransferase